MTDMYKKFFILNIDGCDRDLLYAMMEKGELPSLQYIFKNAYRFLKAESVFPPITIPAQASGITGFYPKNHGIPLNMWVDRQREEVYDYIKNPMHVLSVHGYLPFKGVKGLSDHHLLHIRTLYEGAVSLGKDSVVGFHFFSRGAKRIPPSFLDMMLYLFAPLNKRFYYIFDGDMVKRIIGEIPSHHVLFLYFASCDGATHDKGLEGQRWYLKNVLDPLFKKICSHVEKQNLMDDSLFLLYSDHSHTPLKVDKKIDEGWIFDILQRSGVGKPSLKRVKGADLVISLQGGMAGIYVKEKNWHLLPSVERVRKIASLFQGKEQIEAVLYRDVTQNKYVVLDGDNPMGVNLDKEVETVNKHYYSFRSPDVILFSNYAKGYHFWKWSIKAMHGNINPEEREIPLLISSTTTRAKDFSQKVNIVDITPTILKMMGKELNCDGKALI